MKYINCDLFPQKSSVNKTAFLFYHDVKRYCIMFLRLNLILFKMNRKENSHLLFNNCTIQTQKVLVVCYETEQNNNRYNQYTCMYYIFKECTWTLTFAMEFYNIATKKEGERCWEGGTGAANVFKNNKLHGDCWVKIYFIYICEGVIFCQINLFKKFFKVKTVSYITRHPV